MHCSSLGEFEQGRPVMEQIKKEFPDHKLALSFFSPSGYEVRKDYKGADYVFYLPLDTKRNAKKLVELLHPDILILVKYEYWYNLLRCLENAEIPVIVISSVIKEDNLFFRPGASWFRQIIGKIDHFFVQDNDSESLLNSIGIKAVTVSGDTRFDRVKEIRYSNPKLAFVEAFKGDSNLIVAGSTWPEDEEILAKYINEELPDDWKVIIAPHNIKPVEIKRLSQKLVRKTAVFTQSDQKAINEASCLIVDTIGLLTKIYAYADISYVGGGFTKTGVHNTLEPAVFGVPVIFGPNYQNYFEAIDLVNRNAALSFKDAYDFSTKMSKLIESKSMRVQYGAHAWEYMKEKPNSTNLIIAYVKQKIRA